MRWSTLALLVVVMLPATTRADEGAAVKLIQKLGGRLARDDKRPGKPVVSVDLDGTPTTDADLKALKEVRELRALNLWATNVTDAGLKELKDFPNHATLNLTRCSTVTDAGLKELKALKQCSIQGNIPPVPAKPKP